MGTTVATVSMTSTSWSTRARSPRTPSWRVFWQSAGPLWRKQLGWPPKNITSLFLNPAKHKAHRTFRLRSGRSSFWEAKMSHGDCWKRWLWDAKGPRKAFCKLLLTGSTCFITRPSRVAWRRRSSDWICPVWAHGVSTLPPPMSWPSTPAWAGWASCSWRIGRQMAGSSCRSSSKSSAGSCQRKRPKGTSIPQCPKTFRFSLWRTVPQVWAKTSGRSGFKMWHTDLNGPLRWRNSMSCWQPMGSRRLLPPAQKSLAVRPMRTPSSRQHGCLHSWRRLWKGSKASSTGSHPSTTASSSCSWWQVQMSQRSFTWLRRKSAKCLPRNRCWRMEIASGSSRRSPRGCFPTQRRSVCIHLRSVMICRRWHGIF